MGKQRGSDLLFRLLVLSKTPLKVSLRIPSHVWYCCSCALELSRSFPEKCGATVDSRASGTWGSKSWLLRLTYCAAVEDASSCQ